MDMGSGATSIVMEAASIYPYPFGSPALLLSPSELVSYATWKSTHRVPTGIGLLKLFNSHVEVLESSVNTL